MKVNPNLKTCPNGHVYDHIQCPVCPFCSKAQLEAEISDDLKKTSVPAQRALLEAGIKNLEDLAKWSEKELLNLHGFGPKSIKIFKPLLEAKGLKFKE